MSKAKEYKNKVKERQVKAVRVQANRAEAAINIKEGTGKTGKVKNKRKKAGKKKKRTSIVGKILKALKRNKK